MFYHGNAERLPTGSNNAQPRATIEQLVCDFSDDLDHLLAVVEHQQQIADGQEADQRRGEPLVRSFADAQGQALDR